MRCRPVDWHCSFSFLLSTSRADEVEGLTCLIMGIVSRGAPGVFMDGLIELTFCSWFSDSQDEDSWVLEVSTVWFLRIGF